MLYTYAATALVAVGIGFAGGWKTQDWRYGAIEAKRLSAIAEAEKKRDKASYGASVTFEKGRTQVETRYQTITETVEFIVDRPVYRDTICFTDDGLRALRDATRETATPEPSRTVPTPD
jgi:hypothetical protein